MKRALNLAILGSGRVSPNPMVGCVIVHDNKVIGEGYHMRYGEGHAEVNAIASVEDQSLLSHSTLYVTLEPCSHFGKTPPCADLIIANKIPKVVVACEDPNPLVAGKGIKKLKEAGIEVEVGIMQKEASWLNRRFFTFQKQKRPYVILKWAQTADGFIARENYDSKWISNEYSRKIVHKWRAEEDAVMVSYKTALYDNPCLNVRDWTGRNPLRIVVDKYLQLPDNHNILDGTQKTIVFNYLENKTTGDIRYVKIGEEKQIEEILFNLYESKIMSVIIEGGSIFLQKFIAKGLWDEARIFEAEKTFGSGIKAPDISGQLLEKEDILGDTLKILKNQDIN